MLIIFTGLLLAYDTTINNLGRDIITLISSMLDKTDEPQELKSSRRRNFPIFRTDLIQTNRILAKLAQYAFKGNIARVVSLLKIRPDLRIPVLFTLAGLGAQDEMELILKEHPEDLLVHYPLRDISGAMFETISLFKHAIWAKDVHYSRPCSDSHASTYTHHYCDREETFWDKLKFNKLKLKRSLEVYDWMLGKSQLWSEG